MKLPTPEALASQTIDQKLIAASWIMQDFKALNLGAGAGMAVREFQTASGLTGGVCSEPHIFLKSGNNKEGLS